jgi:23S rRNA (cytidine2498-2'-O)-methyltransferase
MTDLIISADQHHIDLAWQELKAANKTARKQAELADGVWLARLKGAFSMPDRPIFLRHIAPVQEVVVLTGGQSDIETLKRTVRDGLLDDFPTSDSFSVQTRLFDQTDYKPFDVNRALSDVVQRGAGAQLDVRAPKMVLSVAIAKIEKQLFGLVGASAVAQNLSDWAGGERRFKREKEQISRAEFKLLEAIEYFDLQLPESGTALDLGAAPGGWTRVLRQAHDALVVVAVDPGELHPLLQRDWGVNHVRGSAEWYLQSLTPDQRFDVIVNDMRLDGRYSAEILTNYAPHLAQNGMLIMTVKLPQNYPLIRLNETLQILKTRYNIRGVRQLFHNRHEATIWAVSHQSVGL